MNATPIILALVLAFCAESAYTGYKIVNCVTDTECQGADGKEI